MYPVPFAVPGYFARAFMREGRRQRTTQSSTRSARSHDMAPDPSPALERIEIPAVKDLLRT